MNDDNLYTNSHPSVIRQLISNGSLKGIPTAGYCSEFKRVNVIFVPSSIGDAFEKLCWLNFGPLPIQYRSTPGQFTAGPLVNSQNIDIDIPTDIPVYTHFSRGKRINEERADLISLSRGIKLSEYEVFYIGCSLTFERAIRNAGVNFTKAIQGEVFLTNVPIETLSPLTGNARMYTSMLLIPKHQLSLAATVSNSFWDSHGAPIHIGDPRMLGIDIDNNNNSEFVPMFWGCGATAAQVILSNATLIPDAFGASSEYLLISDVPADSMAPNVFQTTNASLVEKFTTEAKLEIVVINYSGSRSKVNKYASISKGSHEKLQEIHSIISDKTKNQGNNDQESDDFVRACVALAMEKRIWLTTETFCNREAPDTNPNMSSYYINTAIISLAYTLFRLGKEVIFVGENRFIDKFKKLLNKTSRILNMANSNQDQIMKETPVNFVPKFITWEEIKGNTLDNPETSDFDVVLTCNSEISTVSPTIECDDKRTAPPDMRHDNKITIGMKLPGIDGKNDQWESRIESKLAIDHLIEVKNINWGLWGVAAGLVVLGGCPVLRRYKSKGIGTQVIQSMGDIGRKSLLTQSQEEQLLQAAQEIGFNEGLESTKMQNGEKYYEILDALRKIC